MKTLTKKSEITSKNLKEQDCDFLGERLGFDKIKKLYIRGYWWTACVDYYETVKELRDLI